MKGKAAIFIIVFVMVLLCLNRINCFSGQDDLLTGEYSRYRIASVKYDLYPPVLKGEIKRLDWLADNVARVTGEVDASSQYNGAVYTFFVCVEGDLDYEQPLFKIESNGRFEAVVNVGREYMDYGKVFYLKVVKSINGQVVNELKEKIVKKLGGDKIIIFDKKSKVPATGLNGIEMWLKQQTVETDKVVNMPFRVDNGRFVKNYRYIAYAPEERYLARYGRITLYGSSVMAKALLVKGEYEKASMIAGVWIAQTDDMGRIPRSANIVGDTYISPSVRSGDTAHFLGSLALLKAYSGSSEYDDVIIRIVEKYFITLQDKETGLIRGGYDGSGDGYDPFKSYTVVNWASAEHNFDLFQSLVLLSKVFSGEKGELFRRLSERVAYGLDNYMWNDSIGTFNRGYRFEAGEDRALALDCASWGALYLLKQARLARQSNNVERERFYINRAKRALSFLEKNFSTSWCYKTPTDKTGCIKGYKPYVGSISDIRQHDDMSAPMINWDEITDFVWPEGTLGVAVAYYEMQRLLNDKHSYNRFKDIVREMQAVQSLSDIGGVFYSSKTISGHFTRGEELASSGWLTYALLLNDNKVTPRLKQYINWIPW
ncbi:MAG: hypothetical protein HQL06_10940 [Nitrospirae bacterium]|nr:hypothetical protein [Nitrospirota bacterium]